MNTSLQEDKTFRETTNEQMETDHTQFPHQNDVVGTIRKEKNTTILPEGGCNEEQRQERSGRLLLRRTLRRDTYPSHHGKGPDGICHEYYKHMWNCCKDDLLGIINNMFLDCAVSIDQKHGHIVCLPKVSNPASPENYRPLTMLNSDYKLLTRILAYRLHPWMEDILHQNQSWGRNGKSIYDAVATVRDIIAYAEITNTSLCLLSIYFNDAFDMISHTFLFKILQEYGISETFCQRLRNIYADATSNIVMNGRKSKPIKIMSGVRQGCPLSMLLFAVCKNHLLITLDKRLQGKKVTYPSIETTAIAYTDDITIGLRGPEEIDEVREILHDYMKATGANINEYKSYALALEPGHN